MAVTINLISESENTINTFLNKYFEKDMMTDNETYEWSYTLPNPLDAANLISSIMDNNLSENITPWISFDENVFVKVKNDNYNDIIKYILQRFNQV